MARFEFFEGDGDGLEGCGIVGGVAGDALKHGTCFVFVHQEMPIEFEGA